MSFIRFSYINIKIDKYLGEGNHGKVYKTASGYAVKLCQLNTRCYEQYVNYYNTINPKINCGYLNDTFCKIYNIEYAHNLILHDVDGKKTHLKSYVITWMELCEKSINSVISDLHSKQFSAVEHQYYTIARQLAIIVKECQKKKLIIGDLSVNNVMINGYPEKTSIKIIDFIHMNDELTTTHSPPEYMTTLVRYNIQFYPDEFPKYNYSYDFIGLAHVITSIFLKKTIYTYFLQKFFKEHKNANVLNNTILLNAILIYIFDSDKSIETSRLYGNENCSINIHNFSALNPAGEFNKNPNITDNDIKIINYFLLNKYTMSPRGFSKYIEDNLISSNIRSYYLIDFITNLIKYDYKKRTINIDLLDRMFD